jgi:type IV pilus assembly protein PilC
MPLYTYKAKDKKGKIVEDVVQANTRQEAANILKSDSLQVLTIKGVESKLTAFASGKISVAEKAAFCRFLATMLRAGLPISEAIENIRKETENKRLRKILVDVSFQIRKGATLSVVLSKYPHDFDSVFLTIIKAGEESGSLDKAFDYLSKQLLASHEVSQKVKGALVYPIVIIIAMIANAVVMIAFVLPKISEVFMQLDVDLPTSTRIILGIGKFAGENTLIVVSAMFLLILTAALLIYVQKTRTIIFGLFTRFPVVNKLVSQIDVARFARTLSALLSSGVPIMPALDVSADTLSQPSLKRKAKEFSKGVAKGESLSDVITKSKKQIFPLVMIQTIRAGEKTGSLEVVLSELAEFYEREVDYTLKRLTSLIEPILMLVIGVAVGAMVVMMVIPIYSIVGNMQGF